MTIAALYVDPVNLDLFEPEPLALSPTMNKAKALDHKWWGQGCPSCGADPGDPCKGGEPYATIHGQRTGSAHP